MSLFSLKRSKGSRQERDCAWQAQLVMATRAPFVAAIAEPQREDPDSIVGEAVADSEAIHAALTTLVEALDPSRPIAEHAHQALVAVTALLELRPAWVAYCNKVFALDPEVTDPVSEMSRLWVSGDRVRAWPRFTEGKAVLEAAIDPVVHLQSELAAFCGTNLVRRQLGAA
jgi:hypothetical protein